MEEKLEKGKKVLKEARKKGRGKGRQERDSEKTAMTRELRGSVEGEAGQGGGSPECSRLERRSSPGLR